MMETSKAVHRLVAGALIASMTLLRSSASRALDHVTLITDVGYNGVTPFSSTRSTKDTTATPGSR